MKPRSTPSPVFISSNAKPYTRHFACRYPIVDHRSCLIRLVTDCRWCTHLPAACSCRLLLPALHAPPPPSPFLPPPPSAHYLHLHLLPPSDVLIKSAEGRARYQSTMLPRIHGKGNNQKQAQGVPTARGTTSRSHLSSRTTDSSKFSKLKEVLVNNLLKDYHRKTKQNNKAGNDAIYLKAVEEVEKILTHGRLTDKQLKELQRKFSAMDGIPEAETVSKHADPNSYPRRTEMDEDSSYRPQPPPTASTQTSPSKRRKQVEKQHANALEH
eukprot:758822-Hanusia_phi.AAC.1